MGELLEYNQTDSFFSKNRIKEFIKEDLIPTDKMNYILIGILLIIFSLSIIQFPLSQFLSGNIDGIVITAGYPLKILEIKIAQPSDYPFRFIPLIIDLIIYIFIAYILDILITLILKAFSIKGKYQKKLTLFKEQLNNKITEIE